MTDHDVIAEQGDYRVLLVPDTDPQEPEDDGATPILRLHHRDGRLRAEAFNRQAQANSYGDAFERLSGLRPHLARRWLRIFHGTMHVASYNPRNARCTYIAFDTDAWAAEVGCDDEHRAAAAGLSLKEIEAWCEGDVWGWRVERKLTGIKAYDQADGPDDVPFTEWDEQDSCWGYYGREYAEQAARDALKEWVQ